ncbi:MAG: nuclear transport factor 2 family protein [Maricaulaceae bacterium]
MTAQIDHVSGRGGESGSSRPIDAYRTDWTRMAREDRFEILKLQALWTAVVRAGRPDRAAEFCAPDVVMLPPDGAPINGREAVRAWLAESFRGRNAGPIERIEVAGVDVRGGSQSAWLTATVTTYRAAPDPEADADETGAPIETERRLWALIKDGSVWRVRLAGWEPSPAEPEGAIEATSSKANGFDLPAAPAKTKKRFLSKLFGRAGR